MDKYRTLLVVLAVWALVISCNMPFGRQAAPAVPEPGGAADTAPLASPTSEAAAVAPTFTAIVAIITTTPLPTETPCLPNVYAAEAVNVRAGPGKVYDIVGGLNAGRTVKVSGKNADGTWWYIEVPGGYGWVSAEVVTAACIPASLVVVPAPPTPVPTPTNVPQVFAVTGVSYAVDTWSDAGHRNCPRITATIKVNGPGTVVYMWTRSDGAAIQPGTLSFDKAGSKSISADWALGSVWAPAPAEWMGIYIDDPNHQDFGHAKMPACAAP